MVTFGEGLEKFSFSVKALSKCDHHMKTTGHNIKWDHFARFCFVFRVDFGDLRVAKVMFSK